MADEPVPYVRFVLAAHGRSGSTLVTEGFRQHPNVRMYGEIFHEDPAERETAMGGEPAYRDGQDGARYLSEVVYRERWWDDLQALGFKLFASHARERPASSVWDALRHDGSLRVVRLVRDDWLRTYVSYEVAMRTDQWVLPVGREAHRVVAPFAADCEQCEAFFAGLAADQAWLARSFRRHEVLDLEYESDIASGFGKTMRRLFEFVGVAPARCTPILRKQSRRSPREQLTNYDALRAWFAGSDYEHFFED